MFETNQERLKRSIENISKNINNLRKKIEYLEAVKQHRLYQLNQLERNVTNESKIISSTNKTRTKK